VATVPPEQDAGPLAPGVAIDLCHHRRAWLDAHWVTPERGVQARQDRKEFLWFSLGATLPMSSISAADAARQIVAAIERGDAEVILTWQAKLLALVQTLAPGPISDILQLVNRVLPEPGPGEDALQSATGHQSQTALTQSRLEVLGHKAARDLNQLR